LSQSAGQAADTDQVDLLAELDLATERELERVLAELFFHEPIAERLDGNLGLREAAT
jgi:hypothetical protein